ncbi:hypothetical protein ACFSQZ_11500 [Rubritalea spongiae]|uniref:Uncharacterized protein n=2 Tax=Rubritalea spongiae TaxID=430797 RepID=A0ABW5E743_9BACT
MTVAALAAFTATGNVSADDTEMEKAMSTASKSLKSLRTIPKDDYTAAADAVRTAHEAILKSMSYTASMVAEMPDGLEKQKALADSRRILGLNYSALCELELAYLEGDAAKIEAATEKMKETKKEGHKKYTDD